MVLLAEIALVFIAKMNTNLLWVKKYLFHRNSIESAGKYHMQRKVGWL